MVSIAQSPSVEVLHHATIPTNGSVAWVDAIPFDPNSEYPTATPEWFAQQRACFQLKHGSLYRALVDPHEQIRRADAQASADTLRYLTAKLGPLPGTPRNAPQKAYVDATHTQERTDNAMKVVNGVITDSHLYCMRQGKLSKLAHPYPVRHVGDLLQLCLDYDLQTLWILPGSHLSEQGTKPFVDDARETWGIKTVKYARVRGRQGEHCTFVSAWKKQETRSAQETGRTVYVGYAEHMPDWCLDEIENPVTLLAAISYVEDVLGVPVLFSTGNAGKKLMEKTNSNRERSAWVTPVGLNAFTPVVTEKALPAHWKRAFTEEEQGLPWLVAYDKNSMYPASCTSVQLGTGLPTLVEHPTFDMTRDKPLPGLWYCRISGESPFNGRELPHPTNGITSGWFWSYTVKLLHELGYLVEIEQAYVWDKEHTHTPLRPFAECIWDARISLRTNTARYTNQEARKHAEGGVKMVANKGLAWLDLQANRTREDTEDSFDRPDWYQLLKDNARYQMFWRIRTYLKKGFHPVGMHEDCLFYLAETQEHEAAIPGMMDRADKLGGFKRKYPVDIPATFAGTLFNDPGLDIGQINTQFNALGKQQKQGE